MTSKSWSGLGLLGAELRPRKRVLPVGCLGQGPGCVPLLRPEEPSAPAPRLPALLLCLGAWDGLDAHRGPLLLIKIIIQLNVLLQAGSFLLW